MKTINLITECAVFKDCHFTVVSFYGKETVGFNVFEKEFVFNSLDMRAYDTDLNELPCYSSGDDPDVIKSTDNYKQFYCNDEIYITVNKGNIGYDSNTYAAKATITETETEFIVSISLIKDSKLLNNVLSAYFNDRFNVSEFCSEHVFHKLNGIKAPVSVIAEKIERTLFIDIQPNQFAVPVKLDGNGDYEMDNFNPWHQDGAYFKAINDDKTLAVGDYLYRSEIENTVEIVQIVSFAHSVYGSFFAVAEERFLYPRDKHTIKETLPDFYKKRCSSNSQYSINQLLKNAETVSYIPDDAKAGSSVIYQKVIARHGYTGISGDIFHFDIGSFNAWHHNVFNSNGGAGVYENQPFIRAESGITAMSLIQINNCFKIVAYRFAKYVRYNNEYYVKMERLCDSPLIDDLNDFSKRISMYDFTKHSVDFRSACRNAEYLLCRNKIKPIRMTMAEYESLLGKSVSETN